MVGNGWEGVREEEAAFGGTLKDLSLFLLAVVAAVEEDMEGMERGWSVVVERGGGGSRLLERLCSPSLLLEDSSLAPL